MPVPETIILFRISHSSKKAPPNEFVWPTFLWFALIRSTELLLSIPIFSKSTFSKISLSTNYYCIKIYFCRYYNRLDAAKYGDHFINITNGVTPRRWVVCANPRLADLITETLQTPDWVIDFKKVAMIQGFADDKSFQARWSEIKLANKKRLAKCIKEKYGVVVRTDALFDVMVKRIHEYKRQLMNILYVIHRYLWIKDMKPEERKNVVPRVTMIGGKAAPGYDVAKKVIKLFNSVAQVINNDKEIGDLLKLVFLTNYSVSAAQIIIPATEVSQHISTAGAEASGTSNMKFIMNGSLIIGTMDGANVEISEEIGKENMFIFGANVDQARECNLF